MQKITILNDIKEIEERISNLENQRKLLKDLIKSERKILELKTSQLELVSDSDFFPIIGTQNVSSSCKRTTVLDIVKERDNKMLEKVELTKSELTLLTLRKILKKHSVDITYIKTDGSTRFFDGVTFSNKDIETSIEENGKHSLLNHALDTHNSQNNNEYVYIIDIDDNYTLKKLIFDKIVKISFKRKKQSFF